MDAVNGLLLVIQGLRDGDPVAWACAVVFGLLCAVTVPYVVWKECQPYRPLERKPRSLKGNPPS